MGQIACSRKLRTGECLVDIERALQFPSDVALTILRPDVMILSKAARIVIMSELSVPWEDNVEEARERKKERYEELVMQCEEHGWLGPLLSL